MSENFIYIVVSLSKKFEDVVKIRLFINTHVNDGIQYSFFSNVSREFYAIKSIPRIYPLLTEFEAHNESYELVFFPLGFMAQARRARAINRVEKIHNSQ